MGVKQINDVDLMRRCFALAINGRGRVEPNPIVGCVIVRGGEILAEGFHSINGGPHAEAVALEACGGIAEGATVYVNLEPCCAFEGKRTTGCAERLIAAKVKRVVIGSLDPNPKVAGRGGALLLEAGIEVGPAVLEAEAKQLNAAFFKRVMTGRPYVTLKWAQDAQGRIAGAGGQRVQISNAASMGVTHALRARCDAILVGINTVLADDPLLTARRVPVTRRLLRVVLDGSLRLPVESRLARTAGECSMVVFTKEDSIQKYGDRFRALRNLGVDVVGMGVDSFGRVSIEGVLDELGAARGVTHLLVEPGVSLARAFLDRDLADRAWVFRSSEKKVDGEGCPTAVVLPWGCLSGVVNLDGDSLTEYLNPSGQAYFCCAVSADLAIST
jgi:diaminohydroxyphosphoribosylaminopyrimidine deaminase / 5-amino-6-(5-phosphoribosylamino)uracil reductase